MVRWTSTTSILLETRSTPRFLPRPALRRMKRKIAISVETKSSIDKVKGGIPMREGRAVLRQGSIHLGISREEAPILADDDV